MRSGALVRRQVLHRAAVVAVLLALLGPTLADAPQRMSSRAPRTQVLAATGGATSATGIAMGGAWTWLPEEAQAADLERIAATGAGWIRVSFRWSAMQPEQDRYDWSVVDRIIRRSSDQGLKVIANVAYTPPWARPGDCDHAHCPPADAATYAAFVETAVRRYSAYGVRAWEIWNEPNLGSFWRPVPDPRAYTTLLQRASAAAKRADPTVTVVSGGLGPRGRDSRDNLTPQTFLERMYAAGGGPALDAVGVHPYSFPLSPLAPSPTNTFGLLPELHAVMAGAGDGGKQLWITEFGYWTSPLGLIHWGGSVTEEQQSRYLTEAFDYIAPRPWIGPALWFTFRDSGEGEMADFQRDRNFGLIREDGTPKPALGAFERAASAKDTNIDLALSPAADRLRATARLTGAPAGATVRITILRRTAEGWLRVRDRSGTVDAEGVYRPAFRRPAPGRCRARARFDGTATHRASLDWSGFSC